MPAAIEAARAALPWWMSWGSVALAAGTAFVVAFASWGAVCGMYGLRLRSCAALPWPERARRAWPLRQAAMVVPFALAGMLAAVARVFEGPLSSAGGRTMAAAVAVSVAAAVTVVNTDLRRRIGLPVPTIGRRLRAFASALIVAPWFPLLAVGVLSAGTRLDLRAALVATTVGGCIVAAHAGLGLRLASIVRLVRPASPRLLRALEVASQRVGVSARIAFEVPWSLANAYALPLCGAVAVTDGALACLDDAALAACCAHELAHLAEPLATRLLRLGTSLLLVLPVLIVPVAATAGTAGVAGLLGALLLGTVAFRAVSRRLESRADATASAEAAGPDLARSLACLYEANLVPVVLGRQASHPDLYDRLVAAGVVPDYPRPTPPQPRTGFYAVAASLLLAAVATMLLRAVLPAWLAGASPYATLLLPSGTTAVHAVARYAAAHGDVPAAVALSTLAARMGRRSCARTGEDD